MNNDECDFDLIVIGGGITGAGVLREAQMRGYSCLLIEKSDVASGTSSRSGKLIHGGLRYLKNYKFSLVFEACRERYWLWKILAPKLVTPVRFVIPFFSGQKVPPFLVKLGVRLYQLISVFRNLGKVETYSAIQLESRMPLLRKSQLLGAISYWDAFAWDFRLVVETLRSAVNIGAKVRTYEEVVSIVKDGLFITVKTNRSEVTRFYKARAVVNCTGAWSDQVRELSFDNRKFNLKATSGIHVTVPISRFSIRTVISVESIDDQRFLYAVPIGEVVWIGTTDRYVDSVEPRVHANLDDVDYLLRSINHYFPTINLSLGDVASVIYGVRPLMGSDSNKKEEDLPRDDVMYLDSRGILSVSGGKLTTYRAMAERAVKLLAREFFHDACSGRVTVCPLRDIAKEPVIQPLTDLEQHWCVTYGESSLGFLREQPENLKVPFAQEIYLTEAEIMYLVRYEWAQNLEDIFIRRIGYFFTRIDQGIPFATRTAEVLSRELNYDSGWVESQVLSYLLIARSGRSRAPGEKS